MSYQLQQELKGTAAAAPVIEMPPLPVEEQPETQQAAPEESNLEEMLQTDQPKEEKQSSDLENNMTELRRQRWKAERERDEYLHRLTQLEQQAQRSQSHQSNAQNSDDPALNPDDLVEWKHVQKYIKKLEDKIDNYHTTTSAISVEAKLKSQYPDFDKIVTPENVEALRNSHPEIAATLTEGKDLYNKAASAYTLIKKLGIHKDMPAVDPENMNRAKQNAAKPRPLTSVSPQQGDTPLSRANAFANGMTDELRKQLIKEMNDARAQR